MPEISIHPDHPNDTFDRDRTKVDGLSRSHWISAWFGNLELTIFGSADDLVDLTGYLHDLCLEHRDEERSKILADFDEQDRRLEVVDTRQEPPDDWPGMEPADLDAFRDHAREDMGEDPFKYEHRSDP